MTQGRTLLLIAAAMFAAVLAEHGGLGWLNPLEHRLSDQLLRARASALGPDPGVVIVDIDDASLEAMKDVAGSWPWPRAVHAELLEGLLRQQPRAVVFDILFAEPDIYRPESDAAFNEALAAATNVYLPILRQDAALDRFGVPLAELAPALGIAAPPPGADPQARAALLLPRAVDPANWRLGAINFLGDEDGVGRRYHLALPVDGWAVPSMPARVARDLGFAVPPQPAILLGWRGLADDRIRISYAELYADFSRKEPRRPRDELRGKIVVIGTTASGLHDIRATPISGLHPAVDILATAIDNLKNDNWLRPAPAWIPAASSLALLAVLLAAFRARFNSIRIGMALIGITGVAVAASYGALARLWLFPLATPLASAWTFYFIAALSEYLRERREREHAVAMFSRFVNPYVVKELVAHGGLSRSGESRAITLLFSDIRGFTTLSESRSPEEVVRLLNRYFSVQVDAIFSHGGSLDKFIGDAIMAFWGAPLDDPEHARHAISAALDMADRLQEFKREEGELGETFDVGIGIHSGPAVVGLIGSDARREYTAIGDTVNLASRIEGLTKGVARILVSEETMRLAGDAFEFVEHGTFPVKGRSQPVRLFEPKRKSA